MGLERWQISADLKYKCGGVSMANCKGWGYMDTDIKVTTVTPNTNSHAKWVGKMASIDCQMNMPTNWPGDLWVTDTVYTPTGEDGIISMTAWVSSTALSPANQAAHHEADPTNPALKPWVLGGNLSFSVADEREF